MVKSYYYPPGPGNLPFIHRWLGTTNTKKWKKLKYGHGWVTKRVNMYLCPERTKLTLLSTNQPINNDLENINMQWGIESLLDRDLFKIEMNETGQAQRSDLSESFNELYY